VPVVLTEACPSVDDGVVVNDVTSLFLRVYVTKSTTTHFPGRQCEFIRFIHLHNLLLYYATFAELILKNLLRVSADWALNLKCCIHYIICTELHYIMPMCVSVLVTRVCRAKMAKLIDVFFGRGTRVVPETIRGTFWHVIWSGPIVLYSQFVIIMTCYSSELHKIIPTYNTATLVSCRLFHLQTTQL